MSRSARPALRVVSLLTRACLGLALCRSGVAQAEAEAAPVAKGQGVSAESTPLVWHVWPLFDPYVSRRENAYAFGLDTVEPVGTAEQHPGWSLSVGQSMSTLRAHMWVRLQRDFVFRASQPSSYTLELSSYRFLAGLRAAGFELGPSVGLVPLALDLTDGRFGVSGMSPQAGFEIGFKVGVLRTAISAYEQFAWHWLGAENSWMHGLSLQLSLEEPRVLKRKEHPLILMY
jgi:hypothetical protein